jgi:predicted small integral membrane protein
MEWMAWTGTTAAFFAVIALLIVGATVSEVVSPSSLRKGLLPMPTTRGDRLFVGLLGSALINLAWVGLTSSSQLIAVGVSVLFMIAIGRWG